MLHELPNAIGCPRSAASFLTQGRLYWEPARRTDSWVKSGQTKKGLAAPASANPSSFVVAGLDLNQRPLGYERDTAREADLDQSKGV